MGFLERLVRKSNSSILANPSIVYIGVWVLVVFLYSLRLTNQFVNPSFVGLLVIVYGFITSIIAFKLTGNNLTEKSFVIDLSQVGLVRNFAKKLLAIWFVGSVVDVIYSGGLPLLWVISGAGDLNYTDFGVPSLHGFLNACYLQAVTILFFCWCLQRRFADVLLVALLMAWPIFMLGRGIFLSVVVQMFAVYLLLNKIHFRRLIAFVFVGFLMVLSFGIIGDMRDTPNPFEYLLANSAGSVFDNLPSGFLWVYVYSTSSLNNFLANVDTLQPIWYPIYTVSNMLPSVARVFFGLDPRNDRFEFVDMNLNTSTVYAGAVSDFGPIGGVVIVFVIQVVAAVFYRKAKSGSVFGILGYAVMFQVLLFSVFYDMFFLLPTLMQLLIVVFYGNKFVFFRRGSYRFEIGNSS